MVFRKHTKNVLWDILLLCADGDELFEDSTLSRPLFFLNNIYVAENLRD